MPITILSQRDQRWAEKKLGPSQLTVGRYGCTTTSICMGLSAFGFSVTPDAIAKDRKAYTKDGLILWQNLKLPGGFRMRARIQGRNDDAIKASLRDPDEFVILQVADGSHWVLATGKTLLGNDYKVADPWSGDRATACGRYRNVTGSAHFTRKK